MSILYNNNNNNKIYSKYIQISKYLIIYHSIAQPKMLAFLISSAVKSLLRMHSKETKTLLPRFIFPIIIYIIKKKKK